MLVRNKLHSLRPLIRVSQGLGLTFPREREREIDRESVWETQRETKAEEEERETERETERERERERDRERERLTDYNKIKRIFCIDFCYNI